jgi:PD-(D/E)XK nuclease superfamily
MKIPVASHTFLDTYERCPQQAYRRYVAKDQPFEETEALKWGNAVHKAMEERIKERKPLLPAMKAYEKYAVVFDPIVHKHAELSVGMRKDGKSEAFFGKQVWMRGKVDVLTFQDEKLKTAMIFDWKTGKEREDPRELEEHAVLIRARFPMVETITGCYIWLKDDEIGKIYDLSDTQRVHKRIAKTMEQVEQTVAAGAEWPAKENPLCGWCSVKDCRYNPRGD